MPGVTASRELDRIRIHLLAAESLTIGTTGGQEYSASATELMDIVGDHLSRVLEKITCCVPCLIPL